MSSRSISAHAKEIAASICDFDFSSSTIRNVKTVPIAW
ncbi:unnamed protein product [Acidithrix sp. C25]|nr:unnamed protein product [Acidithrix sp. C25]